MLCFIRNRSLHNSSESGNTRGKNSKDLKLLRLKKGNKTSVKTLLFIEVIIKFQYKHINTLLKYYI